MVSKQENTIFLEECNIIFVPKGIHNSAVASANRKLDEAKDRRQLGSKEVML
ncbi:hypothetical protein [Fischerella sp. PCC 9605]|uniref:hypothetical protein n=1 Tax=Fischerella sp. PCC 9605 TaxID=1173024 RepID=UPI0004AFE819|nr:hypothetical protein [Fischerella sp. PCC 9605]